MTNKKSQKNFSLNFWLFVIFSAVILISLLIGLIISTQTNIFLNKKIAEIKEAERPADIEIVILKDSSCSECFDAQSLVETIKRENVNVKSEKVLEIESEEGKELISKFNITQAPAIIVSGEIEKDPALKALWSKIGQIKDGSFISGQIGAPYLSIETGQVIGLVELTMLTDQTCSDCYDVTKHEVILRRFGISTQNQQVLDIGLDKAKELIRKYDIDLVPTIILTGDISAYPAVVSIWPQVGTVEDDGTYVFRQGVKQMGVYKDLNTNKVVRPEVSQVKNITVSGSEFSFTPSTIRLKKGENVKLTFVNNGQVPHDFVVDELGLKTKTLQPGQSEIINFKASQTGNFSFYCSVGGHRQAGMEGKIEIQ